MTLLLKGLGANRDLLDKPPYCGQTAALLKMAQTFTVFTNDKNSSFNFLPVHQIVALAKLERCLQLHGSHCCWSIELVTLLPEIARD